MAAIHTYPEFRQNVTTLYNNAASEGEVRVKRRDVKVFVIKPEQARTSRLDVEGIDLNISTDEILQFIAESRRYA